MEICKAPTLRLKALNKHAHIMYIEMENVIKKTPTKTYGQGFKHNYAKDAHTHTHTHTHTPLAPECFLFVLTSHRILRCFVCAVKKSGQNEMGCMGKQVLCALPCTH